MALRDRAPESDFRGYFSDTETKLDEGNTAGCALARDDCVAGHVRLELRNVVANYPFDTGSEKSPAW
jgi:hypothetical protein